MDREQKFLLGIKYVLDQMYQGWSDAAFDELCNPSSDYVGLTFENRSNASLLAQKWQITVNVLYKLIEAGWLVFNKEPDELVTLEDKQKYRKQYVIEKLAKNDPSKCEESSVSWFEYYDLTPVGEIFMKSCDDEDEEIADQKFIRKFIEYFEIKDLKEWIEKPVVQVSKVCD
ncbi:MAG TPA: hypothetical protein IAC41_04085 [Candidatus Merdenecus merdavium]|nr:hypothetical protein [Candidatus Merdenecus merdavium]